MAFPGYRTTWGSAGAATSGFGQPRLLYRRRAAERLSRERRPDQRERGPSAARSAPAPVELRRSFDDQPEHRLRAATVEADPARHA